MTRAVNVESQAPLRRVVLALSLWPQQLSPNWHTRVPASKWRAISGYRAMVRYEAIQQLGPAIVPMQHASYAVRYEFCRGRRSLDRDNCDAAFKAGLDGLRDAHVIVSDAPSCLSRASVDVARHPRSCRCAGRIIVTLEELP